MSQNSANSPAIEVTPEDLANVEIFLSQIDGKNKKLQAISDLPEFLGVQTLEEALMIIMEYHRMIEAGEIVAATD